MLDKLTVTQAARLLGVSRQAVLSLVRRKLLPAERIGTDNTKGLYLIPREAVEKRLAERPP